MNLKCCFWSYSQDSFCDMEP